MQALSTWKAPVNDAIRRHTLRGSNARIDKQTRAAIDAVEDSPSEIRARLAELDREWDIDRALMLNFAVVGSISSSLAMRTFYKHRRFGGWAAMFAAQMGFLAFHAAKRWCPPMPVFRRLGFRSNLEIAEERAALRTRLAQLESR